MQFAQTDAEILACHPALRELRPHLTSEEAFLAQVRRQQVENGYRLGYVTAPDGTVPACAGFRVGEFLAWGRIVYIDDLVTREAARKHGYAAQLMDAIVALARAEGCAAVHLDSGYQRNAAHRFYLKYGFELSSHHFAFQL
jgi:GNAT superfamily N-acetyltransferase